ncbi:MAG: hypothetical protein Q7R98_03605 [Candidatus Jorgensenbacteria bacterium]|nr:hypothetical protein [Candidatus Jorgensenbacteria bacterium]
MYKKLFLIGIISAILIAQVNVASAQSITVVTPFEAIQVMILQIQKQIDILREQIALLTAKSSIIATTTAPIAVTQTNSPEPVLTPVSTSSQLVSTSSISTEALVSTSSQSNAVSTSTETSTIVPPNRHVSGPNEYLPTDTTVAILKPNGGETWQTGSTHAIKWRLNAGSSSEAFKTSILLQSANAGVRETAVTISTSTLSIDGENQLIWTVPQTVNPAANYRVYIQMNQMAYITSLVYATGDWTYPKDESDGNITIISVGASAPTTSASIFDSFLSFFRRLIK